MDNTQCFTIHSLSCDSLPRYQHWLPHIYFLFKMWLLFFQNRPLHPLFLVVWLFGFLLVFLFMFSSLLMLLHHLTIWFLSCLGSNHSQAKAEKVVYSFSNNSGHAISLNCKLQMYSPLLNWGCTWRWSSFELFKVLLHRDGLSCIVHCAVCLNDKSK